MRPPGRGHHIPVPNPASCKLRVTLETDIPQGFEGLVLIMCDVVLDQGGEEADRTQDSIRLLISQAAFLGFGPSVAHPLLFLGYLQRVQSLLYLGASFLGYQPHSLLVE